MLNDKYCFIIYL